MRLATLLILIAWLVPPVNSQNLQEDTAKAGSLNPWTAVNSGLPGFFVYSLLITPEGTLIAGTNVGIYRSSDKGNLWEASDTVAVSSEVGTLAVDAEGVIYAGSRAHGIFRSLDDGASWEEVTTGLANLSVGKLAAVDGVIYAGTNLGAVYRSTDQGESWEELFDNGLNNPFVPSVAVNDQGIVFTGSDAGVFRSIDEGATWEATNTGLGNLFIESLEVSRDNVLFAGSDGGVFRSVDDGDTWEAVHDSVLEGKNIRALVSNSNFALFAGTHESGVFRSLNHGATWESVSEGLTDLDVHALVITPDDVQFAATVGGGVFRRDAATDVANEEEATVPTEFELAANYPNPFNPSTRISYALPEQVAINLSVFDTAGRLVRVLVDTSQAAGRYDVNFDASSLPSGVYFYRLKTAQYTVSRQMVLLR